MKKKIGEFEELVLLSVAGLKTDAYAIKIQEKIATNTGRSVTMGALYTALDRLEDKGFVASQLGAVTPKRGGRRKRYYQVTQNGIKVLLELREWRNNLWADIEWEPLIDPGKA